VLARVARRVPGAVISLLSALRLHELTPQAPSAVWITLPEKARRPRLDYPRLAVARSSGDALTEGVEVHRIERVDVRVYSAAKTVADCFEYRNKLGIDVAVEALRDYSRSHRGGAEELARFARICRVSRVMQPYLDSIVRWHARPICPPRIKDFFDLHHLASRFGFDRETRVESVRGTLVARSRPIPSATPFGLTDEYWLDPSRPAQLRAFMRRAGGANPAGLDGEFVDLLRTFLLPVLGDVRSSRSDPGTWSPGGPRRRR